MEVVEGRLTEDELGRFKSAKAKACASWLLERSLEALPENYRVPGDRILKVNDMEMNGVTREEAVLFLLSLQDQIELVVQHKKEEYDQVVASGHGDSFYVK